VKLNEFCQSVGFRLELSVLLVFFLVFAFIFCSELEEPLSFFQFF